MDTLGRDNVIAAVVNLSYSQTVNLAEANGNGARARLEMEELSDPHTASKVVQTAGTIVRVLYQRLKNVESEGFTRAFRWVDMDDINDYRPGVKARNEEGVRSLLQEAGLYKLKFVWVSQTQGRNELNKTPSCSLASSFPIRNTYLLKAERPQGGRILHEAWV